MRCGLRAGWAGTRESRQLDTRGAPIKGFILAEIQHNCTYEAETLTIETLLEQLVPSLLQACNI